MTSVIVAGARTPIGKLLGSLKDFSATDLGGFAIKATTVRWLDNSDDLRAVTVNVGSKGGAVQGTVRLLLA